MTLAKEGNFTDPISTLLDVLWDKASNLTFFQRSRFQTSKTYKININTRKHFKVTKSQQR